MKCSVCGKELNTGKKYCSGACYQEARRARNVRYCKVCGQTFYVAHRTFCSRSCALLGKRKRGKAAKMDKKGGRHGK